MHKIVLVTLVGLATAGCTAQGIVYWKKPGATAAEMDRDRAECEYEATRATGGQLGIDRVRLQEMCLNLRGWKAPG